MSRSSRNLKEEDFSIRVPADLKAAFEAAIESADRPAARVIGDFMRAYVENHRQSESGYDSWFREQVQAAIDDPRPGLAHDEVMLRARAVIDAFSTGKAGATGKAGREG